MTLSNTRGLARLRTLVAFALLSAGAISCGGSNDDSPSASGSTTTAAATRTSGMTPAATARVSPSDGVWSPNSVWPMDIELLRSQCDDRHLYAVPSGDPELAKCVPRAMQLSGANPSAIAFVEASDRFLTEFEEVGRVDFGRAAFPSISMGRGEPVLLNGSPSIIFPAELIPENWADDFSYEQLLAKYQDSELAPPSWFFEYGRLVEASAGGQTLTLAYPLQQCRACEQVGTLRLSLTFDSFGQLESAVVLSAVEG